MDQTAVKSTTVKILDSTDDHLRVGGYGVVFGGVDLEGETFGPDTDFMDDLVPVKLVLYDHGQNKAIGREVVGKTTTTHADEWGLWVEAELDRHADYMQHIETLLGKGALGWSSGSVGHLTEREGKAIKKWPIVEFSLTPTPAEPRTLGVEVIKHLAATDAGFEAFLPEGARAAPVQDADEADAVPQVTVLHDDTETDMSEETKAAQPEKQAQPEGVDRITFDTFSKNVEGKFSEFDDALKSILQYMQETPKIKNAGYYTEDGGSADPEVKSFGDFLLAVQRHDTKRLTTVYRARKDSTKALGEDSGAAGGYLVPDEYLNRLMQVQMDAAVVRPRATVIPVNSNSGSMPSLDQEAPSSAGAGISAFAGGVKATWTDEAGSITETDPAFKLIEWNIRKMAGYTKVSNELIADSGQAIETLLTTLFGRAVAAMEDYAFLRGDGVGKPLGILNSGSLVTAGTDDSDFSPADALAMISKFQPLMGGGAWYMHRSVIPDFADFTSNNMDLTEVRMPISQQLHGYPIIYSEHLPQTNNTGDVLLADMGSYIIFDRGGLAIAFSEHANFTTDQGTWRFTKRLDGKPWLNTGITLADPQGSYEVSPFVVHNE